MIDWKDCIVPVGAKGTQELPGAGNGRKLAALRQVDSGRSNEGWKVSSRPGCMMRRSMTKQQIEYMILYESGYSVSEIAKMKNRSVPTVSRVLKRAKALKCPFSADCKKCPLPDCGIDKRYALLFNGKSDCRRNSKKSTSTKNFYL